MKVCPFCREEVHDEAIKCRYCSSSLLPAGKDQSAVASANPEATRFIYLADKDVLRFGKIVGVTLGVFLAIGLFLYAYEIRQAGRLASRPGSPTATAAPAPAPDQVKYVLDQDLVRFAKFAGAVLAIFVTVGLFLYGFDIKQSAKEVREAADSMRQIRYDIGKAKDEVAADRSESRKLLQEAQESLSALKRQASDIQAAQNDIQTAQENTRNMVAEVEASRTQLEASLAEFRQKVEAELKQMENFRDQAEKGASSILEKEKEVNAFATRIMAVSATARETDTTAQEKPRESFSVPELVRLYEFPSELDGSGQCIGVIELGGGYRKSDLETYFKKLKLPLPRITPVFVDGAKNAPTRYAGADAQVTMNIEVAGAVAPAAHIVVYFAPNTNEGFLDAIRAAINDKKNRPGALVICWGAPEANWTKEAMSEMNRAFQDAATQNITVVAAAGDNAVTDGVNDGKAHIDFPASSPWVLACGGTRITASASRLISEVVWNDTKEQSGGTGGGVSNVFPLPDWQTRANIPVGMEGQRGRGIPDVAASASPLSGYKTLIRGQQTVIGGTTGAVPLWAGLIILLNQAIGRNLGFINPLLYSKLGPDGVLRSITEGHNGVGGVKGFSAGLGWNACAGWGSPNGKKLLEALREHIGAPQ